MKVSFIHRGGPAMASYRYRAMIPAEILGATINSTDCDTVVFSKPMEGDYELAVKLKKDGARIILDICDDHLYKDIYSKMINVSDLITCSSKELQLRILKNACKDSFVIGDPYEYEGEPHADGENLLWFGHQSNIPEIVPLLQHGVPILCVTGENKTLNNYIPWSVENLGKSLTDANSVIIPDGKKTRSFNRAVNAIAAGCFVIAGEQHQELKKYVWANKSIVDGIRFIKHAKNHLNDIVLEGQEYVKINYSPEAIANKWREIL